MSYLYVCDNKSIISLDGGYFTVKDKTGCLTKVPRETLESISIFGNALMTVPCTKECLIKGIPVNYFSVNGAYFGRLESTRHVNVFRLKQQVKLSESNEFRIAFTKEILKAKMNNQLVILRRYVRNRQISVNDQISEIKIAMSKIEGCHSVEACMGYEGMAAKAYFKALSKMIPKEYGFFERNRRPPKDAFNSLLSLGYSILMSEIYGEIENNGLNPYVGFMHSDRERHPSLASDLIEEWRAIIVDSMVLNLVTGNEIHLENFWKDEEDSGGVFIDRDGIKIFYKNHEKKMRQSIAYAANGNEQYNSCRKAIWHQINALKTAIDEGNPQVYHAIKIR